jgi:putative hydrolase of the HAD superfamily
MITAIFFDWGHTFVKVSKSRVEKINKVLKPFGSDWQKFYPYWGRFYILRSAGKIKSDKDFEISIQRALQKAIPVKKIIEISIKNHIIPKEHIRIIKELKKKYKVGILSNNVYEWVHQILKNYKIEKLFDTIIISSKVGARKPNALIYYKALRSLSVKPEETIFIADEIAEDLVAASGLGMKTIWLNTDSKGWWVKDDKRVLTIYKPDATIKSLKEVIPMVGRMQ